MNMNLILARCAGPLLILVGAHAHAGDGAALAKAESCMVCHAVDKPSVGPSFVAVAARYKADPEAVSKLTASVKAGSTGHWGATPMPPNAKVTDDDAKALATWILTH